MISTPATTAAETSTNSAGASFFEILAGASTQPSNGTAIPVVNARSQKDSDTANQNAQPQSNPDTNAQIEAENDPLQNIALPIVPKSTAAQPRTPQTPTISNNSGTNRTAGHDQKTQTASSVPTTNLTALATIIPVQIAPVSAQPVPSPGSSIQGNSSTQNDATAIPATAAQATAVDNTPHIASALAVNSYQSEPVKLAVQGGKFAVQAFDPSLNAAAQPGQPQNSSLDQTTGTANASAPQSVSSAVPPDASNRSSSEHTASASHVSPLIAASAALPDQSKDSPSVQTTNAVGSTVPQTLPSIGLPLSNMSLPDFNTLPGANTATQPTVNATQSGKANNMNQPKTATITDAVSATTNSLPASASASASSSTHATQNNAQGDTQGNNSQNSGSGQHTQSQTTPNQPAPQTPANSDSPALQIQVIAPHSAPHETFATHIGSDATVDTARSSERSAQPEINETPSIAGINTANVIQKMNETEMRVGMHSAEFGEISIRTSVTQQQMVTQISVDHGDLGKAISAHIPTIEAKLGGELGLRALVQVSQNGMSFSGERNSSSPQHEQRAFVQLPALEGAAHATEADTVLPHLTAVAGDSYRLDIRA